MKFTIQRQSLMSSVQNVMKAISSKAAIPILTGMKLKATTNGITLTGSDSDISIESFIPAKEDGIINVDNIEEGGVVLQARYFPDIIRKLPNNTVNIETDDHFNVMVTSGKAEFNLNGQDASEYPQLPDLETDKYFEIPADLLKDLIGQTVFAVSTMETRPILTGVNIKVENETLHFTATDSHRLASRRVPLENIRTDLSGIVVPGKSLNELNKILDDKADKVEVSVTNNQILFRTKHMQFLSRLLEGNYPETSRLIPEQSQTMLQVKRQELISTIDRASLLARDEHNNVVKLTSQDSRVLQITSNSPEVGQVAEEISAQSLEGENLKISFSSRYMLDALKVIEGDEVVIHFTGAMRPFIIQPTDDDAILQLILPVRTY